MRHDDAIHFRTREMCLDPVPNFPHARHGHVRARKHAPLVELHLSDIREPARRMNDLVAAERGHRTAGARIVLHRDGAAGKQYDDHPQSTLPPFTLRISPVMWRASGEQRNTIGPAMSSAEAMRPKGIPADARARPSAAIGCATISVST